MFMITDTRLTQKTSRDLLPMGILGLLCFIVINGGLKSAIATPSGE